MTETDGVPANEPADDDLVDMAEVIRGAAVVLQGITLDAKAFDFVLLSHGDALKAICQNIEKIEVALEEHDRRPC